jgi:hypothetical protein
MGSILASHKTNIILLLNWHLFKIILAFSFGNLVVFKNNTLTYKNVSSYFEKRT